METYSMTQKELDQIPIMEALQTKEMKQKQAATILNVSIRQIRRKLKRYKVLGGGGLTHGLRGKAGNHQLNSLIVSQTLALVENYYCDFAPTFASQKLLEDHGIAINHETLRLKMIKADLWKPWSKRIKHRSWRERKANIGELVMLDGSDHEWFENRAPRCTLLAFIDDASSRLLWLEFVSAEATIPVMEATKSYLEKYGRPLNLYVDRGKVFKVNLNNPDDDKITQYRRCLDELGINVIYAYSPQAKGRVERLFGTLQDRLVKELRLANISSLSQANMYVGDYMKKHNERFSIEPKNAVDLHRSIQGFDLKEIFSLQEQRIVNNDFTLRYQNRWFQLGKKQKTLVFPGNAITVITYLDGSRALTLRQTKLDYAIIPKPIPEKTAIPKVIKSTKSWVPPVDHPWRQYQPKVTFLNC